MKSVDVHDIEVKKSYVDRFGLNLSNFKFIDYRVKKQLELVRDYLPDSVVLDLGCGPGLVTRHLFKHNLKKVIGVDLSYDNIAFNKKSFPKDKSEFIFGSAEEIEFSKNCFDVIICTEVLEHLADDYKVLQKVHTWLKPEGIGLFSVPNYEHISNQLKRLRGVEVFYMKTHVREYTYESFRSLLSQIGFEILYYRTIVFPFPFSLRLPAFVTFPLMRFFINIWPEYGNYITCLVRKA